MIEHNIKSEEKLIELLGYSLIGPDNCNRWLIVDEKNNSIGFIQYKKVVNKDSKKNLCAIFGYHMEIDSKNIHYNSTRKLNNRNEKSFHDSSFSYEFEIKREDGNLDHIAIDMGRNPSLNLWSKEYGFINFKIDYESLFLNFKSKTQNFNIEETIVVKPKSYHNLYEYSLSYCDKNEDINSKEGETLSIDFIGSYDYICDKEKLKVNQKMWKKGNFVNETTSTVDGNINDAILMHEMGINSFNHFRYLINQILPFKKEVISEMLEIRKLKELEYRLFIDDLNNNKQSTNNVKSENNHSFESKTKIKK